MCENEKTLLKAAEILKQHTPVFDRKELDAFVCSFVDRRKVFLKTCDEHGSPLYLIEKKALLDKAKKFISAFQNEFPDLVTNYAVKSNNCPLVISILVEAGLGLDVSSGRELELALSCKAKTIVFSGPGKTEEELSLAVQNRDRVIILLDSFSELRRLENVASKVGKIVKTGVRLTTDERGLWRKFGISLLDLSGFFAEAEQCKHIDLRGLQFHTSWNLNPQNHVQFIDRLGTVLGELEAKQRSNIEFIDIGGGFWPQQGEWMQPEGTTEGKLRQILMPGSRHPLRHHKLSSTSIDDFAKDIGQAIRTSIFPHVKCRIFAEPGRWICHDSMHILLKVIDKKAKDIVITDAGTNAIGWERFEVDYFPVINLSRPEIIEHECYIMGSLCTPHDVWGYSYYGKEIEPGDILLIPTQGAYTYSLRQEFIKPLPKVVIFDL